MEASRKLGMSAKNTMQVAQRLYQNGLITYMRTDGVQIGEEGVNEIRSSINKIYGDEYLPSKSNETLSDSIVILEILSEPVPSGLSITGAS